MSHKDLDPSSEPNGDDLLKEALRDLDSDGATDVRRQFAILDRNNEFYRQVNTREEDILNMLAGKIQSARRLSHELQKMRVAHAGTNFDDLAKVTAGLLNQVNESNVGEPRTEDLIHLDDLVATIFNIACASLDVPEVQKAFWATKAGIQAAVSESSHLSDEDKQALIETTEQYVTGQSFDDSDPLQAVSAHIELNDEEVAAEHELFEKAGRAIDDFLADEYGINVSEQDYLKFKELIQNAIVSDEPTLLDAAEEYLGQFNISKPDFYTFVRNTIPLIRDPDWDDDYDWAEDE